jgi:hypothetical protein
MRNTFIQDYERRLVESAVESAVDSAVKNSNMDCAVALKRNNVSRDIIMDVTGIDIDEI